MNNIISMQQVHGGKVVLVTKKDSGKVVPNCDGLITNSPDVSLQIRVADCLPIFIKDLENNAIGLVHAGWRGLEVEIVKNAIGLMQKEFASEPKNLSVFIGPHICQKHFEIKSDVSVKFENYKKAFKFLGDKMFLDMGEVAKEQFEDLGVKNIQISKDCTFENEDLFSYRRESVEERNFYEFKI